MKSKNSVNGNNWLLLVVFVFAALTGSHALLAILTLLATMFNFVVWLFCSTDEDWAKEAFDRNLTEASVDNKVFSLLLWTLIWGVLLRYDFNILVLSSVFARSLAVLSIRLP